MASRWPFHLPSTKISKTTLQGSRLPYPPVPANDIPDVDDDDDSDELNLPPLPPPDNILPKKKLPSTKISKTTLHGSRLPYPPVTADDILDVDDDDSDELKPPPLPPPDYILPEKKLPDSSKRLTPPPDASNHRSPFMYSDKDSSDDTNSKTSFGEYDENDKFDFGSHEINRSFEEPDGKLEGKLQTEKPNNQLLKKVEISDILPVPDWDNCSLEHIYDHICPPINDKDAQSNHRRWVAGAINAATRKKLQVGIMWNSMSKQLKDQNHNIHSVLSEARADTMKKRKLQRDAFIALSPATLLFIRKFLKSYISQAINCDGDILSMSANTANETARLFHIALDPVGQQILNQIHSSAPKNERRANLDDKIALRFDQLWNDVAE